MERQLIEYLSELDYKTLILFARTVDKYPVSGVYGTSFLAKYIVNNMGSEEIEFWCKVFKIEFWCKVFKLVSYQRDNQ